MVAISEKVKVNLTLGLTVVITGSLLVAGYNVGGYVSSLDQNTTVLRANTLAISTLTELQGESRQAQSELRIQVASNSRQIESILDIQQADSARTRALENAVLVLTTTANIGKKGRE